MQEFKQFQIRPWEMLYEDYLGDDCDPNYR